MNRIFPPSPDKNNGELSSQIATCDDVLVAAYHTAHYAPGKVLGMAKIMQMSPNTLQKKVHLLNDTHHLTLAESVMLQEASGDFRILHAMSARLGFVSVSMNFDTSGTTLNKVTSLGKEFGEVLAVVNDSVGDGNISPNEMRCMEREAGELMAALHNLVGNLRSQLPACTKAGAV